MRRSGGGERPHEPLGTRPSPGETILIVDGKGTARGVLARAMASQGRAAEQACDASAALAMLARVSPQLVITDVDLPGIHGFELLEILRARTPDVDAIVVTSRPGVEVIATARRLGALEVLPKPLDMARVLEWVERAFAARRLRPPPDAVSPL